MTTYQPDEVVSTDSGTKFNPHPDGSYPAVCVDVINLGEKVETYQGKTKVQRKLALVFRTGEKREDGEYFEISCEFTNSMNERAGLRQFMESWRGKPYAPEEINAGIRTSGMAGAPALLNVVHKVSQQGRTYAKVASVMRLPKGMEAPDVGAYKRADYWQERKDEYAKTLAAHYAKQSEHDDFQQLGPDEGFDRMPPSLETETDDLPF